MAMEPRNESRIFNTDDSNISNYKTESTLTAALPARIPAKAVIPSGLYLYIAPGDAIAGMTDQCAVKESAAFSVVTSARRGRLR